MRFQLFLLVSFMLFVGGIYALLNGLTMGQMCRETGRSIRNFGYGMDASGNAVVPIGGVVAGVGKAMVDTCSPT